MSPEDLTRRQTLGTTLGLAVAAVTGDLANASDLVAKEEKTMERVTGIGGFFFRSKDPDALAKWYEKNLGVAPVPTSYGGKAWHTEAGTTVFAPFKQDTTYFGDPSHHWMINFRVSNLDKMAAQLRAAGATVEIDPETYPNGRFAKVLDPEENPIQLWEPGGVDKS